MSATISLRDLSLARLPRPGLPTEEQALVRDPPPAAQSTPAEVRAWHPGRG